MEERSQDSRHFLSQLAREYNEKYTELEEMVRNTPPDQILHQLRMLAEMTTDRCRAAQLALFDAMASPDRSGGDDPLRAALAVSRSFDELHILFQFLLEHSVDLRTSD